MSSRKTRVFVIDDEPKLARIVQVNLINAGFDVDVARDGVEALGLLTGGKIQPDVILMDIIMPRMDGFALLEKLKEHPDLKQIPVVLMTARSRDRDILEGQIRGAAAYLTKPISPNELLKVLREALGKAPSEDTANTSD